MLYHIIDNYYFVHKTTYSPTTRMFLVVLLVLGQQTYCTELKMSELFCVLSLISKIHSSHFPPAVVQYYSTIFFLMIESEYCFGTPAQYNNKFSLGMFRLFLSPTQHWRGIVIIEKEVAHCSSMQSSYSPIYHEYLICIRKLVFEIRCLV